MPNCSRISNGRSPRQQSSTHSARESCSGSVLRKRIDRVEWHIRRHRGFARESAYGGSYRSGQVGEYDCSAVRRNIFWVRTASWAGISRRRAYRASNMRSCKSERLTNSAAFWPGDQKGSQGCFTAACRRRGRCNCVTIDLSGNHSGPCHRGGDRRRAPGRVPDRLQRASCARNLRCRHRHRARRAPLPVA